MGQFDPLPLSRQSLARYSVGEPAALSAPAIAPNGAAHSLDRAFTSYPNAVPRYNHIWRLMSKEDSIEVTGTVVEKFPSGLFSVQLDQERTVLAHLAGKLRRNRIRVLAGDRVTLELSPYDLTKGRITYRHK
jgi:translation initiation factor IF-1